MGITITHHELTVAFGVLGNITSFTVFLAPVPTFYRIWKKKSTESFQCLPYQVALFSCMLGLYYALLRRNAMLLVTVNTFGCIVEAAYIILFIAFATSSNRNSTIKVFVLLDVGAFSAILLLTHYLHIEEQTRVVILGWISVGFNILVFAAPLSIVAHVIRTKSVEFMPFTLSFYLTLSAVMWFEYGLFLKDIYIALPNILGFVLGMVQMLLYAIFRNSSKKKAIEDKKLADQELKSVVVIRNSEAHPFETEVANEDEQNREQNQTDKGEEEEEEEEQPPQEKKTVTSSEVSSEVIQQNDSPPV